LEVRVPRAVAIDGGAAVRQVRDGREREREGERETVGQGEGQRQKLTGRPW
jgi:hypothetical protein